MMTQIGKIGGIIAPTLPSNPFPPNRSQPLPTIGRQEVRSSWSAPAEAVDNSERILLCRDEFFKEKEDQELLKLIFY
jgi:hypothetical protein